jgi:hypothetical protein
MTFSGRTLGLPICGSFMKNQKDSRLIGDQGAALFAIDNASHHRSEIGDQLSQSLRQSCEFHPQERCRVALNVLDKPQREQFGTRGWNAQTAFSAANFRFFEKRLHESLL